MKTAIVAGVAGLVVCTAALSAGFFAGHGGNITGASSAPATMSQAPGSTPEQVRVEEIVRNYLLTNPEIMVEVQAALEDQQRDEQKVAQTDTIREEFQEIFNAPYDGVIGNPDGKVTLVEFFDYNCTYCRHAQSDMQALVDEDPELRFVLKEFPILGPDSQKAHIVSMAFRTMMPEKYNAFHDRLLGSPGRANEAAAIKLAVSLGADEAELREAMKNPEIKEAINGTYALANKLAITGTPSYVVGDEVVFGALGADVLAEKVELARACLDGTC